MPDEPQIPSYGRFLAEQEVEMAKANVVKAMKKIEAIIPPFSEFSTASPKPKTITKVVPAPTYRLERTDTGQMKRVLVKARQPVEFIKGEDYDKVFPPEKPSTRFDAIGKVGDYVLGIAHKMGLPTIAGVKEDVASIGSGQFLGKLWDTTKAIPEAQGNELIAAYNEWEKAGASDHVPLASVRHFLGGIIPIIGPALSRSGSELERGNIKEASQDFLAAAIPIIAPALFKSARGLVAKGATPEAALMQAADEHLSPLLQQQPAVRLTGVDPEGLPATRFLNEQQRRTAVTMKQQPLPVDESLSPGVAAARQAAIETPQEAAARAYKAETAHHSNYQPRADDGTFVEGKPVLPESVNVQPETSAPLLPQDQTQTGSQAPQSQAAPVVPEVPRTTGIANAVTEAERADRGLSPIETAMTREWSRPVLSEGKALVDGNPAYRATVSDLADNPRVLTDAENAALTYDRMRLHNEHAAVQSRIESAIDSGDQVSAQRLRAQLATVEDAISENDVAAKVTGTEAGRGFNARKMMMTEDYSLASLVQKAKVASGKTDIPTNVRTQLTDLSKQIADLTARLDKAESTPPKALVSRTSAANVVVRLEAAADAARARIAARKAGGQAGFIGEGEVGPEGLPGGADALADYVTIGAAHLARIGTDFATWSAEMVREFGDSVRPYLQQIYAAAKDQVQGAQSGRLATYKKGLTRRTEAVEASTPPSPRSPLLLDPAAEALKKQLADAQAKARDLIDRQAPGYWLRRAAREGIGIINLPRAFKASLDVSAPGRQGMWFSATHPIIAKRAFMEQINALRMSRAQYDAFVEQMTSDPAFLQAQRVGGVEFTGTGGKLGMHEEPFMSDLTNKLWGIRHSEQAYSAFLNSQRLQMWKLYTEQLQNPGLQAKAFGIEPVTPRTAPQVYKALGDFINNGTGRGTLGEGVVGRAFKASTPLLNSGLFAPRWIASRYQLLNPVYYAKLPAPVRLIAMREAIKFTGMIGATLYLAKKAGATVGTDPDDPDFLKLKVGNVHYDISGGFQQEIKFVARMMRAAERTRKGTLVKGQGGDQTVADVAGSYLRNKLSPIAGAATDVLVTGEMKKWGKERPDQTDEKPLKPTVGREALELFMPMVANDMIEAYQVEGGKGLAKVAVPSLVGISVNTYPSPSPQKQLRRTEGNRRREIKRERQVNAQ
jgi:hypothetical protein